MYQILFKIIYGFLFKIISKAFVNSFLNFFHELVKRNYDQKISTIDAIKTHLPIIKRSFLSLEQFIFSQLDPKVEYYISDWKIF